MQNQLTLEYNETTYTTLDQSSYSSVCLDVYVSYVGSAFCSAVSRHAIASLKSADAKILYFACREIPILPFSRCQT